MSRLLLALAALTAVACAEPPCEQLKPCDCVRRNDCETKTEPCWCPSECDPSINCVCGGGKFLSCAKRPG